MLLKLLRVQGGSHNKPLSSQTVNGAEVEKPCMEARKRAVLLVEVQNLANNRDRSCSQFLRTFKFETHCSSALLFSEL